MLINRQPYFHLAYDGNYSISQEIWTRFFALLCFVVVIHWLIFPYPSGLLHWHCGNLTIAPMPAKQPWWIWINTSFEFIMNNYITTTKQSTTKQCAYFLGYTVLASINKTWQYHIFELLNVPEQNKCIYPWLSTKKESPQFLPKPQIYNFVKKMQI